MGHALYLCVLACLSVQMISATPLPEEFNDLQYDPVPNLITAMAGYDVSKSTPYGKDGDKGSLSPIFNPIYIEDGEVFLRDFISKAGEEVLCEKTFSTKSITSYSEYRKEKGSSMDFSAGGSVSAGGYGVEAKVGYEYGETKEDREVLNMFETNQGEVVMTTLSCSVYVVEIARYIKPVFMENFISGMRRLANGAVSSDEGTKSNNFRGFLAEFGTHYQKQTRLGAKMIYEKRFNTRSKSKSESSMRSACAKHAVSAEVKGSYGGFSAGVEGHTSSEKCKDQANSSENNDDSSDTESKFISVGIFPTDLSNWENAIKDNNQKPLPLHRKLDIITRLFTPRNLEGLKFTNQETGQEESLNGTLLSSFYVEQYQKEFLTKYPNERKGCSISGSCKIGQICKNEESSTTGFTCSSLGSINRGTVLYKGDIVRSPNGKYRLKMQGDGNLVLYKISGNTAVWATGTEGCGNTFRFQDDGNLVIYNDQEGACWNSQTYGQQPDILKLRDDGILALMDGNQVLWQSMTNTITAQATLNKGDVIQSVNREYNLLMQSDGNLVIYRNKDGSAVWSTGTVGCGNTFRFQDDGNLVIYNGENKACWASNTRGVQAEALVLRSDGTLALMNGLGNSVLWHSHR